MARLAFERSGTRLCEALIAKFAATSGSLPTVGRERRLQVVTDPRTTFAQSLHAIVFAVAHAEEREHLAQVRQWLLELARADAGLASGASRSPASRRSGRKTNVGNAESQ